MTNSNSSNHPISRSQQS